MKFSFSIVYVIAIMNVCMSTVHFALGGDFGLDANLKHESDDSNDFIYANVINKARGGFISYLVGLSFGVTSLGFLRILFIRAQKDHAFETHFDTLLTPSDSTDSNERGINSKTVLSPPAHAFYMSQNEDGGEESLGNGDHDDTIQSDNTPIMSNGEKQSDTSNDDQQSVIQRNDLLGEENTNGTVGNNCGKRNILIILAFESGLISMLSILPCIRFPLIRLHYLGLLTPLLDETVQAQANLDLWGIIHSISTQSGKGVFAFASVGLFWINVILIPIFTFFACISVWFFLIFSKREESIFATRSFWVMKLLHPSSCLTPFTISLIFTVSSLEQVTDFLFNRYGLCESFGALLGLNQDEGTCLIISGNLESGFWFLILHVFSFDFCVTVLRMMLEPLCDSDTTIPVQIIGIEA